ncbi:MAG: 2-hydroxyacyl-CoA dehydratase subunit D [Candidatus Heimdallarchaeota archaeon]
MAEQTLAPTSLETGQFFPFSEQMSLDDLLGVAREWIEDLTFQHHLDWREKYKTPIVGTFPVYVPRELISAFGMLPVALQGGGEFLEISHAEAYLGSFICSIPKSTLELALAHNVKGFDGFISPYICDVARNLAGVFERNFPQMTSHMLHYPQNIRSRGAVPYLIAEYKRLITKFEKITGKKFNPESLRTQIKASNQCQQALKKLLDYRNSHPGSITIDQLYIILRLGSLIPHQDYQNVLNHVLSEIKRHEKERRDFVPILVMGPFCEQPTLEIIKLIEEVGFLVVDFDFQIGQRFITEPISEELDPLEALATAYVKNAFMLPTRHNPQGRTHEILSRLKESTPTPQAVIFLTTKFCEPALEDFVLYKEALEKERNQIPYLHVEYEERSSNFEDVRLQFETLFESILFD